MYSIIKLIRMNDEIICENCGEIVDDEIIYCGGCGNSICEACSDICKKCKKEFCDNCFSEHSC
jgi:hypothetical protein